MPPRSGKGREPVADGRFALGLRLAVRIGCCADQQAAIRAATELLGGHLRVPVASWRCIGAPPELAFVAARGLGSTEHRRLAALTSGWLVGDRIPTVGRLIDVFSWLTGAASPRPVDLGCGLLVLGERVPEVDAARADLARLITALPDARVPIDDDRRSVALRRERDALESLTARELEILMMIAEGAGTGAIAERLQISAGTVKSHVQNIRAKLGVASRLEAAALARRHLVTDGS
jgi:DNA-binding CsgD family transcriptional regulator